MPVQHANHYTVLDYFEVSMLIGPMVHPLCSLSLLPSSTRSSVRPELACKRGIFSALNDPEQEEEVPVLKHDDLEENSSRSEVFTNTYVTLSVIEI